MTDKWADDKAREVYRLGKYDADPIRFIAKALIQAKAEERERCAVIVDHWTGCLWTAQENQTARAIAAAIRDTDT